MKIPRKTMQSLKKWRVCNVESGRVVRRKVLIGLFGGYGNTVEDLVGCRGGRY